MNWKAARTAGQVRSHLKLDYFDYISELPGSSFPGDGELVLLGSASSPPLGLYRIGRRKMPSK